MDKIQSLIKELESSSIRSSNKKDTYPKLHIVSNRDHKHTNAISSLINEYNDNRKEIIEKQQSVPTKEQQELDAQLSMEYMRNLKETNPKEYYRILAGFNKVTSKKSKRKRRLKHT